MVRSRPSPRVETSASNPKLTATIKRPVTMAMQPNIRLSQSGTTIGGFPFFDQLYNIANVPKRVRETDSDSRRHANAAVDPGEIIPCNGVFGPGPFAYGSPMPGRYNMAPGGLGSNCARAKVRALVQFDLGLCSCRG
jgi:hypothetical protein